MFIVEFGEKLKIFSFAKTKTYFFIHSPRQLEIHALHNKFIEQLGQAFYVIIVQILFIFCKTQWRNGADVKGLVEFFSSTESINHLINKISREFSFLLKV